MYRYLIDTCGAPHVVFKKVYCTEEDVLIMGLKFNLVESQLHGT